MTDAFDPDDWTIPLRDRVTHFSTDGRHVIVLFAVSAAEYHLSADRPDFADLLARVASSWSAGREVAVRVDGSEIVSVDAIEGG